MSAARSRQPSDASSPLGSQSQDKSLGTSSRLGALTHPDREATLIGGAVHDKVRSLPAIAGVPRDVYAPWWPYHELRRSSRPHLEFRPTDNCNNGRAIRTIKSVDNAFYLV